MSIRIRLIVLLLSIVGVVLALTWSLQRRPKQLLKPGVSLGNAPMAESQGRMVVIIAHADDWQLFAGDVVYRSLQKGDEVTIIQIAAGFPESWPCWEKGQIASIIAAIEYRNIFKPCAQEEGYGPAPAVFCAPVTVQGHSVQRCRYKNGTVYFLRLPATWCLGCSTAGHAGCPHNQNDQLMGMDCNGNSLIQLYRRMIPNLTSLGDHPSTYRDYNDLRDTVAEIVGEAARGLPTILTFNPRGAKRAGHPDHLDHAIAGCIVRDSPELMATAGVQFFSGYDSDQFPANRTSEELTWKSFLFWQIFSTVVAPDPSFADQNQATQYDKWLARTFFEATSYPNNSTTIHYLADPFLHDVAFACQELRK